jgi:hypothetical protein
MELRGGQLLDNSNHSGLVPEVSWLTWIFCGARVIGANMGSELFVALVFIVHLHIVNGFVNDRPERFECPCAFRASPALKILAFDPYQFATHRFYCLLRDL